MAPAAQNQPPAARLLIPKEKETFRKKCMFQEVVVGRHSVIYD